MRPILALGVVIINYSCVAAPEATAHLHACCDVLVVRMAPPPLIDKTKTVGGKAFRVFERPVQMVWIATMVH